VGQHGKLCATRRVRAFCGATAAPANPQFQHAPTIQETGPRNVEITAPFNPAPPVAGLPRATRYPFGTPIAPGGGKEPAWIADKPIGEIINVE